jgi:pyroglutamyl-peptidase
MKKYLVTGFEAFGGDSMNPTEALLNWISKDSQLDSFFATQLLPVEYSRAYKMILEREDLQSFEGIICFGLAGGRSKISLERVALNWIESRQPDNAGVIPDLGTIDNSAPPVFINKMNLLSLQKDFEKAGLPVEISLSAGGYVCNQLYFQLLNFKLPVLFIHVPYLEEQIQKKELGTAFITESDLIKMLHLLMQKFRAN